MIYLYCEDWDPRQTTTPCQDFHAEHTTRSNRIYEEDQYASFICTEHGTGAETFQGDADYEETIDDHLYEAGFAKCPNCGEWESDPAEHLRDGFECFTYCNDDFMTWEHFLPRPIDQPNWPTWLEICDNWDTASKTEPSPAEVTPARPATPPPPPTTIATFRSTWLTT